jgi:SNF2 family DNA or RNA helicase
MAKSSLEKKKARRKAKQKHRRQQEARIQVREKAEDVYQLGLWHIDNNRFDKAILCFEKAIKLDAENMEYIKALGYLGNQLQRTDIELKALDKIYRMGQLNPDLIPSYCRMLATSGRHADALSIAVAHLPMFPELKTRRKSGPYATLSEIILLCRAQLKMDEMTTAALTSPAEKGLPTQPPAPKAPEAQLPKALPVAQNRELEPIPVHLEIDIESFQKPFAAGQWNDEQRYHLALEGTRIRFKESFESLICLAGLKNIRSLWYQEETARKVLRRFRGRALLADEVGLGKTIEAGIVLREYIERGMVKSALVLTPTPLVSQWKEELAAKFDLAFVSTDDAAFRGNGDRFWQQPFVLASINQAKSKKNYDQVTARDYDLVIVDEAHHLKSRTTLNWKLVNALKKRFLLLLTATPVENNLLELYNLITLLKPGQLKTASEFKKEFMTRGDPTDPQNRTRLRALLGEVMIRNTRALADIDLPPRFAETVRVEPTASEQALYERITRFCRQLQAGQQGTRYRLLMKNLLEEAGSSPRAVALTLGRMQEKKDLPEPLKRENQAIHNLCRTMDDTRKNRLLHKMLQKIPGKKIVFVKYLGTVEHLSDFLSWEQIPHALFHGGLTNAEKDASIQRFHDDVDVLVTTEVGGEGRNLQFCHQMINYDLPWNPMKIEQRIGRIHRIGQEKEVRIFNFCAAGSIEDYILDVLDRKINMFEMVIGEIDMIMGRVRGEPDFSELVFDIWLKAEDETERKKEFGQLASQLKRSKTSYEKTKALDEKLFGETYEL